MGSEVGERALNGLLRRNRELEAELADLRAKLHAAEQERDRLQTRVWSIEDEVIGPYNEELEKRAEAGDRLREAEEELRWIGMHPEAPADLLAQRARAALPAPDQGMRSHPDDCPKCGLSRPWACVECGAVRPEQPKGKEPSEPTT